ncbi:MAG: NAD(P)-dependent oxidoreductase [Lentisphaerae bacterium]|nr:NAD(P)-dependent oxidoreductase [Lentisphaerota bacterium]
MKPKLLLLGHTGKLGQALNEAFCKSYAVTGLNRGDFDASAGDDRLIRRLDELKPAVIVNAVVFTGLDACEREPARALAVNTLFPKTLAGYAGRTGCVLVHISSEAVFPDAAAGQTFVESSAPRPINIYGFTKFGADCFVSSEAPCHYIVRLPMLFGETVQPTQFVEKMAARILAGEPELKVATDCWTTPSYTRDLAAAVCAMLVSKKPFGLYHLTNAGEVSLYDLISELVKILQRDVRVLPVAHAAFTSLAVKNLRPILASEKIPPLRPWPEALRAYGESLLKASAAPEVQPLPARLPTSLDEDLRAGNAVHPPATLARSDCGLGSAAGGLKKGRSP